MNWLNALKRNLAKVLHPAAKMNSPLNELYQYKYALDQSCIIAVTDQKGLITYVNDNFCKISKYSRKELLGQDHRIVNSGYHSKEFIRSIWTTITKGKVWKGELKNKASDGSYYWVDTTIVPLLNETGKPYQYLAIRSDITEKKTTEEKQLLYEQIIRSTEDAIISKDLNGLITSWNRGAEIIFGYTKEEVLNRHISMLIPPDRMSEEPVFIASILADRHVEHFETERFRKDGTRIHVSIALSPIKDITGKIIGASKILRDITRKKMNEMALADSEQKYRSFFEDSPLPMWVTDKQTLQFLDVNETALKEYGYSREEFLSMSAYDIRNDNEKERLAHLAPAPGNGTRNAGIWQHIKKDGSCILAEMSAHNIAYGGESARLVMSNNVTEREAIRERVEQSEMRFRNTLDKMLEGVQIIGFDWRYIYVNEAMAKHGKYPREKFPGCTVMEMYPGIEQTDIYKVYQDQKAGSNCLSNLYLKDSLFFRWILLNGEDRKRSW
jgi:PAS domain S-box-containing protein